MTTLKELQDTVELTRIGRVSLDAMKDWLNNFLKVMEADPITVAILGESELSNGFDDIKATEMAINFFHLVMDASSDGKTAEIAQIATTLIMMSMSDSADIDDAFAEFVEGHEDNEHDCENCPLSSVCELPQNNQ